MIKKISEFGKVYKTLRSVPDNSWNFTDPTPHGPAMLYYRDKSGKHEEPIPLHSDDCIALMRDPKSGDTLCLMFNQSIPRAHLLRFVPAKDSVYANEAFFEGSGDEFNMLNYPPQNQPTRQPTLRSLSVINVAKRMALHFVAAASYWTGCAPAYDAEDYCEGSTC